LLQLCGGAGVTKAKAGVAARPKGGVQLTPSHIGLRLSGPGHVVLGLVFGELSLDVNLPVSELQGIADFLTTQARIAASEPGLPQ
jgi:hypothetical protein